VATLTLRAPGKERPSSPSAGTYSEIVSITSQGVDPALNFLRRRLMW